MTRNNNSAGGRKDEDEDHIVDTDDEEEDEFWEDDDDASSNSDSDDSDVETRRAAAATKKKKNKKATKEVRSRAPPPPPPSKRLVKNKNKNAAAAAAPPKKSKSPSSSSSSSDSSSAAKGRKRKREEMDDDDDESYVDSSDEEEMFSGSESECSSSGGSSSSDEEDDDDDEEGAKWLSSALGVGSGGKGKKQSPVIIMLGGNIGKTVDAASDDDDDDDDDSSDDSDADEKEKKATRRRQLRAKCSSEDEKTFMKENYQSPPQTPPLPDVVVATTTATAASAPASSALPKNSSSSAAAAPPPAAAAKVASKKNNNKKMRVDDAGAGAGAGIDASVEYMELVDIKKDLLARLQRTPRNRVLRKAIADCKKSIRALVSDTREGNTTAYKRLLSANKKNKSPAQELDYFRCKMSNKEQLQIMHELREVNKCSLVERPYRLEILESDMPVASKAMALQRLDMMNKMDPGDSEYFKLKYWVDGFMRIPFGKYRKLTVSMQDGVDVCTDFLMGAKRTLDNSVYGLEDAKMQILQMVGQWITNPAAVGSAIAIRGPMGTGKTSLAKEGIAKIYGRDFAYIPLGGASDSSYLLGHGYTYEGSTFGRIAQILMECRSMNPIIYFDELDKVSESPRGEEIINTLIHLTDTTQNAQFHDRFFAGIDLDLSRCLFVFSYNDENKVSPILRDRMYVIQTKKYDHKEKLIIANLYLLPRIRQQVNFHEEDITIPDDTLRYIIGNSDLTKQEDGVRNLKRCLEILFTKLNLYRLTRPDCPLLRPPQQSSDTTTSADTTAAVLPPTILFPYTVTRRDVDFLVNVPNNSLPSSLLSMYV